MRAVLIDPYTKNIQEIVIRQENLLGDLRQAMGLTPDAGMISQIVGPGTVLWLHAEGLMVPDLRLWSAGVPDPETGRLPQPIAGRGVLIGCNPMTGQLGDMPIPIGELAIQWRDELELEELQERWRLVQAPQGLLPVMERMPVFRERSQAELELPQPVRLPTKLKFWVVSKEDGRFRALQYTTGPEGMKATGEEEEATSLMGIRDQMGVNDEHDRRVDRDDSDHPSVVETWIVD